MPKVGVNQLNRGNAIRWDNDVYIVAATEHVKPGKGPAYVQMKLKHGRTGRVIENRFRSQEDVEQVDVDRGEYTFSYATGDRYVFMHQDTFEELEVVPEVVEEIKGYLVEGNTVTIVQAEGQVISVDLPKTVVLDVVETEPGIKNASATNVGKPAKMNTGITVTVPPFINQGERIKVDTDTGEYVERYNA